jgi:ecotin
MKLMVAIAVLGVFALASLSHAADPLQAFPPAQAGMVRYVLQLPKQADESALKVELIVGKSVLLDAQNRYFFGGRIQREDIKGWGYTRYVVDALGPMAGTRMAVDPGAPKVERFVALGGEPYLIRYNSRLPVVVYVPEGVEVRYRIWKAGPEAKAVAKG